MFRFIGRIVSRAWWVFLLAWLGLVGGTWLAAPPWDEVAQDKEFAFLPANSPSRKAEEVYQKAFPDDPLGSNIVVVLNRTSDASSLPQVLTFISDVIEPGLRKIAQEEGGLAGEVTPSEGPLFSDEPAPPPPPKKKRSIIQRIRTPNAPGSGALLISPDQQALLVEMELTTEFLSAQNWPTIDKVESFVQTLKNDGKIPAGVEAVVTGSAVIGRDHTQAELQSARATSTLTVILVIGLLIVIYRAPLLALIPLLTVFLTVQLALSILAILGQHGYLVVFQGLQIYITILTYGAGVDYCLFLTARYKEILDRGDATPREAVEEAIADTGAALTASAATVAFGIAMMAFARFGKFREAGMAIPPSLFLVLCATLSFSPTLLRLAGRWAFWPHRTATAPLPASQRGLDSCFAHVGFFDRAWQKLGQHLVRRAGTWWLVTLAVMAPFILVGCLLRNNLSYDVIGDLPGDSPSVVGTMVLKQHFPAGMLGSATLLLVDSQVDFRSDQGQALVAKVTDTLRAQQEDLGLADIRSLTVPLGLRKLPPTSEDHSEISAKARQQAIHEQALSHYVSDLGAGSRKIVTRFDLVLNQSPFTQASIDDLQRIQNVVHTALPAEVQPNARLYFVGASASVRDLQAVMQQDRVRIEVLVVVSVLVVLVLLLRRAVVPLYLLATVLLSYFATLGVTFIVFWALDPHHFTGLDWKVAIFLFTILIAVGEDYNIFLISRINQETRVHDEGRGIVCALTRTGPVISSCGIIMAGTFGALMAGTLSEMKQLGFALAFGVLLDTFVVRPVLVPAFLILLHNGRLWRMKRHQHTART